MVASGQAEVRAYRRSPLHAKAYLCWYDDHAEPGSAVVGSSNLTLAGFSGNTELNVRVTGDAEMTALREWFDALWDDSENISEELQVKLELSWALAKTPPYHVYLKALYELYQGGAGASELPLPPRDEELANFQLDAVRRGLAMIDVHGGCYIGDVVGLGKTFIGAELLRQLQFSYPNDGRPLILCPAGLKPMWELFNERFQLGAAVISHSMIAPSGEAEFDEDLGRYVDAAPPERGIVLSQEYPDRGPVLVDEAHNFRNRNQRYAALEEYLEAGDHKVVLLSATPQNLGPLDIYRQLSLFLDDTDHGLPIEPLDLQEYFGNAQRWLDYQVAYANYRAEFEAWERDRPTPTPPLAPAQPTVPRADITQVLSPLFIRRRRRDIRDLYGDTAIVGGQPVRFPEPVLENVDYRLDRVYARSGAFEAITDALEAHEATRYRASDYLLPAVQGSPGVPGAAACQGPDRGTDEGAAPEAARVERRGVPFHARLAGPEQSQLPGSRWRPASYPSAQRQPVCSRVRASTPTSCWRFSSRRKNAATPAAARIRPPTSISSAGSAISTRTTTCWADSRSGSGTSLPMTTTSSGRSGRSSISPRFVRGRCSSSPRPRRPSTTSTSS